MRRRGTADLRRSAPRCRRALMRPDTRAQTAPAPAAARRTSAATAAALCASACAPRTGCCGGWGSSPRTPPRTPASPCAACRVRAARAGTWEDAESWGIQAGCCCVLRLHALAPTRCLGARRAGPSRSKLGPRRAAQTPPPKAHAPENAPPRRPRPAPPAPAAHDACVEACQRSVCSIPHQVPAWNESCLKRCTAECTKGRAG